MSDQGINIKIRTVRADEAYAKALIGFGIAAIFQASIIMTSADTRVLRLPTAAVGLLDLMLSMYMFLYYSASALRWAFYRKRDIFLFMLSTVVNLAGFLFGYATLYLYCGLDCNIVGHSPKVVSMFECLYFSGVTWTTIGYGDFVPAAGASRFFAVIEALHAYLFLGVFAAVLIQMFSRFNPGGKAE